MRKIILSRIFVLCVFSGLLGGLYWRTRGIPPVQAQPQTDPNVIWNIGVTDNAGDEFGLGAEASLRYEVTPAATPRLWRERQDADGSVYKIVFPLNEVPQRPPVFAIDRFFMEIGREASSLM